MFGLSFGEIAIIAILALLLLGPDRLPDAAKTLAKGLRELRRASDDLKDQLGSELGALEDAKRSVTGALAGALEKATREDEKAAPPEPRGPPPEVAAANVPGLEAALVEPEQDHEPAGSAPPKDGRP